MPNINYDRIDHVAIVVTDVERARDFYVRVLGLKEVPRPESFDFPGAWFEAGSSVLHLLGMPQGEGGGRAHFCFWVTNLHEAAQQLSARGAQVYWKTDHKIIGIDRFFTADPDDNRLEFQGPEAPAGA